MEIIIYAIINAILIAIIVLAAKYWSVLGALGGLIGTIFSYMAMTDSVLVVQSVWSETTSQWMQQTTSMGFFAYVPLVLMATCFILTLKK